MSGDVHVRFYERLGVRLPRATHRNVYVRSLRAGQRVMANISRFIETRLSGVGGGSCEASPYPDSTLRISTFALALFQRAPEPVGLGPGFDDIGAVGDLRSINALHIVDTQIAGFAIS
jgi:hypothetical protein